jgi:AraC-like DNA-binding protein
MPPTGRSRLERSADPHELTIAASHSAVGLLEHFRYPPGPALRGTAHVHDAVQICFSVNFPGRYRSGRFAVEVPAGAVSIVDGWEPHAAEDPADRPIVTHYHMLYVPRGRWDAIAADLGVEPRIGIAVQRGAAATRAFHRVYAGARESDGHMADEERLGELVQSVLPRVRPGRGRTVADRQELARARDFIFAHATAGVSLSQAAHEAGLSPQHFAASFRARYGVPPHRFQTLVRLDRARALLAAGVAAADVAVRCGFSDQSHLIRHFKRYLGLVPSSYRAAPAAPRRTRQHR